MNHASCERPHSVRFRNSLELVESRNTNRGGTISKKKPFSDCVILSKDTFDPDAVFLDDIVDDDVLPYLSMAVDGLNSAAEKNNSDMKLRPADADIEELAASTMMPVITLDPEQLEVYGWESSLWRKLRAYLGF